MKTIYILLAAFCMSGCVATFYDKQPPACPNVFVPANLHWNGSEYIVIHDHYEKRCNEANDHSNYYYDPK
jgi:hypothetical protein